MNNFPNSQGQTSGDESLAEFLEPVFERWKLMIGAPLGIGVLSVALSFLFPPIFTATTVVLPPQQRQGGALLAMLGDLGSLAGAATGSRSQADQYVSLLATANVRDRLIEKYKLKEVYGKEFRQELYDRLDAMVTITAGKKDGLLTIMVDDESPERAAAMANDFVAELRRVTNDLALTDAQQRRVFFEAQLKDARQQLDKAQSALGSSGFADSAINAEPRAAAERFAQLSAQVTAQEVVLRSLRATMTDNTPEVQRVQASLAALRAQRALLEKTQAGESNPEYLSRYREFKYRETLFEMMAKQYELARVDEAQDAGLIQVVDEAVVPDKKSRPKRALIGVVGTVLGLLMTGAVLALRGQRARLKARLA